MRGFSVNIKGRVKNYPLPKNQPLFPLYEAVVNSFHAIEERRTSIGDYKAQITIELVRNGEPTLPIVPGLLPEITGFIIRDNGIGFNDANMKSFTESDSTYKAELGGKGVGRFSWLLVFKKAIIDSRYYDDTEYVRREFEFLVDSTEIDDELKSCDAQEDNLTTVELVDCLSPYKNYLPKNAMTIAMHIIHHCLIYFIADTCPIVKLIDGEETLNLNNLFHENIKTEDNEVVIKIGEEFFKLLHVKAEEKSVGGNKLFMCANNRVVDIKELEQYVIDLDKRIYKDNGFLYLGVLTGKYLDENVDMNRLSFNIPDGTGITEPYVNQISMKQIMDSALIEIGKYLSEYLQPVADNKMKRIKNYATNTAPQYRHLLKYKKDEILKIKPYLSDDKLDEELHKIKRRFDSELKEQNQKLLDELNKGVINNEEYEHRFMKQMKKVNAANGATLAEYIAHRKVIIDLLEMGIKKGEDGKFQKEKFIHNLIYPMRKDSNEEPYDNHNLWLIDEKLAYSNYISSDIPFANDNRQERTDIMVLDRPVAVSESENDGSIFDTITLFELKRPMRDDYTDSENPITQLLDYVDKIMSGEAKDKDGRPIKASPNTKFYLYAVCDVISKNSRLSRILRQRGFNITPDGLGYFLNNPSYNAYIEVLPFDKMINDSKKRNKVLFEKLGL